MALQQTNQNNSGSFVPTTFILDVAKIQEVNVNSKEFKELLVRLYQNLNRMALVLNSKTGGYYPLNQFVTGNQYFPDVPSTSLANTYFRPSQRTLINFGTLPNNTTKSVAHNITVTANTVFVRIYGTATDQSGENYIPLPYASSTSGNNIELKVNATDVTVITGSNRTNFTICYIVLEWVNN